MMPPDSLLYGWTANGEPKSMDQFFPDNFLDLLLLSHLNDKVDFDLDREENISDDDVNGGIEEL